MIFSATKQSSPVKVKSLVKKASLFVRSKSWIGKGIEMFNKFIKNKYVVLAFTASTIALMCFYYPEVAENTYEYIKGIFSSKDLTTKMTSPTPSTVNVCDYHPACDLNLGIDRVNMPQYTFDDMLALSDKFGGRSMMVNSTDLVPIQREVFGHKLGHNTYFDPTPILVDKNNYVIDGHHRWMKNLINNVPSNIIKLSVDLTKVFNFGL